MKKIGLLVLVVIIGIGVAIFVLAQTEEIKPLPELQKPSILIKKKDRILEVYDGDQLIRSYRIALGSNPTGDKEIEGDGKTPEGDFYIFTKNADSKYYLSLGLSYPSVEDAERGLKNGLIPQNEHDAILTAIADKKMPPQNTKLGGEIYIHGGGRLTDWTAGCIALPDAEIKVIFDAFPVGAPVSIEP